MLRKSRVECGRNYCPNDPRGRRHPRRACVSVYHCRDAHEVT